MKDLELGRCPLLEHHIRSAPAAKNVDDVHQTPLPDAWYCS